MALNNADDVIELFRSTCKAKHRLFIPDSPRQERIAESLYDHFSDSGELGVLESAVELFIESKKADAIQVYDFAIKAGHFADQIREEIESKEKIKRLMKETEELMEEYD